MKYELYSYIEHGNVIEQQMPGIHVHNQIRQEQSWHANVVFQICLLLFSYLFIYLFVEFSRNGSQRTYLAFD